MRKYYEGKYHRIVPSHDSHSFLINELEKSYGDEKELGEKLRSMRNFRNFADYNSKFYLRNVEMSEKCYMDVIKLLENLNKKSKR